MSESKIALYKKMHKIMVDVSYLSKDDHVKFGQQDYKALSEGKVTSIFREKLIEQGLIIFPVKQDVSREGNVTQTNTDYKIVDIETGEYEMLASSGQGADTQDKGVGKAMTYSYKYLFLRTFATVTGEDPDKVSSAELDEKEKQAEEKKKANAITSEQVGQIKTMVLKLSKLKDQTPDVVYEALGFKQEQLVDLNKVNAEKVITKLNKSIDKALPKEEKAS